MKFLNFDYKDCTNPKDGYEINRLDEKPINLKKLAYIEMILNRKEYLKITTPIMVCLFGFNNRNNEICLQFTNHKTNKEMDDFYNFIEKMEHIQMKYIGFGEDNCDLYNSQIRQDKESKYDPYLVVKVPFRNNKYEVDVLNKENNYCSITNLYKFTRVKCDIYIDKIWKYNDRYICKWKVEKILLI